jgi:hypothetical protein
VTYQRPIGQMITCMELGAALNVPTNLRLMLRSGSTLTHYGSPLTSMGKSPTKTVGRIRNRFPYWMFDADIRNGDAMEGIMRSLPTNPDVAAGYDCTVIACMLNTPKDTTRDATMMPNSDIGAQIIRLCRMMQGHRRPILTMGGSARLWSFLDGWDTMAAQIVLLCRTNGALCIDGVQHLSNIRRAPGGWHSAKTEEDMEKTLDMVTDAVNAAFAVIPHGTYPFAQVPPSPAATAEKGAGTPTQAGSFVHGASASSSPGAIPSQEGPPLQTQ